jgi:hypothetical protein
MRFAKIMLLQIVELEAFSMPKKLIKGFCKQFSNNCYEDMLKSNASYFSL